MTRKKDHKGSHFFVSWYLGGNFLVWNLELGICDFPDNFIKNYPDILSLFKQK